MIILRTKTYSSEQKETKKQRYLAGEETDHQKKTRRDLGKTLVSQGAILGGGLAVSDAIGTTGMKAGQKKIKARVMDSARKDTAIALDEAIRGRVAKKDKDTYNKLLLEVDKRVKHNEAATKRFVKRANKIVAKDAMIKGAKGALKGAAVGAAIALPIEHAFKKHNEKINRAKRNKKNALNTK